MAEVAALRLAPRALADGDGSLFRGRGSARASKLLMRSEGGAGGEGRAKREEATRGGTATTAVLPGELSGRCQVGVGGVGCQVGVGGVSCQRSYQWRQWRQWRRLHVRCNQFRQTDGPSGYAGGHVLLVEVEPRRCLVVHRLA